MTWQRIDENTYIDGTLVTCAKYQIFIDEMREQGQFYQPDHWNSYQFPSGQAREPILGVRHSDAEAFCEWLTKREANRWYYRLPSLIESTEFLLMPNQKQLSLGFWLASYSQKFKWLDPSKHSVPIFVSNFPHFDQRFSNLESIRSIGHNVHAVSFNLLEELKSTITRAVNRDLSIMHKYRAQNSKKCNDMVIKFTKILLSFFIDHSDLIDDHYRDLENFLRDIPKTDLRKGWGHEQDVAKRADFTGLPALVHNIQYSINKADNIAQTDIGLSDSIPEIVFRFDKAYQYIFVDTLRLLLGVSTLNNRIAGRSPAFEGIRLVKEQIK